MTVWAPYTCNRLLHRYVHAFGLRIPREVVDAGVEFLAKPFSIADLAVKVRSVLDA